jgi:hypothetical protein
MGIPSQKPAFLGVKNLLVLVGYPDDTAQRAY